jgi:three-Cys-motif partner protein
MVAKDLHRKPFDEATETKLDIFERYVEEWLPVFIQSNKKAIIVDFFAGPGKDVRGNPGSPLRILKIISKYADSIELKNFELRVIFNELNQSKCTQLKENLVTYNSKKFCTIECFNKDFKELFDQMREELRSTPALLFMDQNGIKHINKEILLSLDKFRKTDFIFFISSSHFNRFVDDFSFKKHLPFISREDIDKENYYSIHRQIYDAYKKMLHENSKLRLYPFSIKRRASINGLIFGTQHVLGADKFLTILWKKNPINGEADFDIDDDVQKKEQGVLFAEFERKTKIEAFEESLEEFIAKKETLTNKDIYEFTLENGFISTHAHQKISKLVKQGKLEKLFTGRGNFIGYKQCCKKEEKRFKWIKK